LTGDVGRGCGDASRALLLLFDTVDDFENARLSRRYSRSYITAMSKAAANRAQWISAKRKRPMVLPG
jgi:hypothetical protein